MACSFKRGCSFDLPPEAPCIPSVAAHEVGLSCDFNFRQADSKRKPSFRIRAKGLSLINFIVDIYGEIIVVKTYKILISDIKRGLLKGRTYKVVMLYILKVS